MQKLLLTWFYLQNPLTIHIPHCLMIAGISYANSTESRPVVFREVNMCTNHLAKGGCTLSGNFVVLDSPPIDDLFIILNSDAFGMYSLRLLSITSPFVAS